MAEGKTRTRRSRSEVINEKISTLTAQKEKYTQKIADIDEELKKLQEELNNSRTEEVMSAIASSPYSIDQVLEMLKK